MTAGPCAFSSLIDKPLDAAVAGAPLPFCFAASLQGWTRWAKSARAGAATHKSAAKAIAREVRSVAMRLILGCLPQCIRHQLKVDARVVFVGDLPRIDAGPQVERQAGLEFGGVRDGVGLQSGKA